MLKLARALEIRQAVVDVLRQSEEGARSARARLIIDEARAQGSEEGRAREAFALVMFGYLRLFAAPEEGERALIRAVELLRAIGEQNRKLMFLARDALVFLGNHYYDDGSYRDALTAYEEAIHKERDPDRRLRGMLNIARTQLAAGDVYKSLAVILGVPAPSDDVVLRCELRLLEARAYLVLGYEKACARALETPLSSDGLTARQSIEARYLALQSRMRLDDLRQFLMDLAAFCAWVAGEHEPRIAEYYELERLVFAAFSGEVELPAQRPFLTRLRHLGKRLGRMDLVAIGQGAREVLEGGDERSLEETLILNRRILALVDKPNLRVSQLLSLMLARRLAKQRRIVAARHVVQDLVVSFDRLEVGIEPAILGLMPDAGDSGIRNHARSLLAELR